MTTTLWLLGVLVVGWAQRAFRAARLEAAFRARFPNRRDGIIVGAEARTYEAVTGKKLWNF